MTDLFDDDRVAAIEAQARRATRASFWTRLFLVMVSLLLVAAIVTIVVLLATIRGTQLDGTPTGKKLVASADRILDCTEPGDGKKKPAGDCYRRSQRQTADILTSAQRIIILSAACSTDLDPAASVDERIAAITVCVTKRLAISPAP